MVGALTSCRGMAATNRDSSASGDGISSSAPGVSPCDRVSA